VRERCVPSTSRATYPNPNSNPDPDPNPTLTPTLTLTLAPILTLTLTLSLAPTLTPTPTPTLTLTYLRYLKGHFRAAQALRALGGRDAEAALLDKATETFKLGVAHLPWY